MIPQSQIEYVHDTPSARAQFCARIRSDLRMVERSDLLTQADHDRLHGESRLILESRKLIYPPFMKSLGIDYGTPYKVRKVRLGVESISFETSKEERTLMKFLQHSAAEARKNNWRWRIGTAAEELQRAGWYPFFITLTVDPKQYDPEEVMRGTHFQQFRKKLAKVAARSMGHPPPHKTKGAKESDYVKYVGNVEHGKSRLHHHSHYLLWMRSIPNSWKKCPNSGIRNPQARNRMECVAMKRFWPYSDPKLSKFCYFRTINDIWEANGHCMPLVKGKPFEPNHASKAGSYLVKYMTKGDKEWDHKVKSTRNLGLKTLRKALDQLPREQLVPLTWRAPEYSQNLGATRMQSVPLGLLRRLAKQRLFSLDFECKETDIAILMQSNISVYPKMLRSVRDGQRPDRMPSQALYEWLSQHLPEEKEFCEYRYKAAMRWVAGMYPQVNYSKRTAIGANHDRYTYSVSTWSRVTSEGSLQVHGTAQGSRY